MKKLKWLIALIAMLFFVNNYSWGQWNGGIHDLSGTTNGTTYDYYAGTEPKGYFTVEAIVIPPSGGSKTLSPGVEFSIGQPGVYAVAPIIGSDFDFFMRCIQDPSKIVVTDHGDGTATISGIDPYFEYMNALKLDGTIIGAHQTSYTVKGSGTVTYILVMVTLNVLQEIPITVIFSTPAKYTINLSVYPQDAGTVSGGGVQDALSQCTITATPKAGNRFVQWRLQREDNDLYWDAVSNDASYTFTVVRDNMNFVADFDKIQVTAITLDKTSLTGRVGGSGKLTATITPADGTVEWVSDNPAVATVTDDGTVNYVGEGSAAIHAESTYNYLNPSGYYIPLTTRSNKCYVTVLPAAYSLTVTNGSGSGTYAAGTVVPIVANTPPAGQEFDQWTGDITGIADVTAASTTYTMGEASAEVIATYKDLPWQYSLTVINGKGSGNYYAGTVVPIVANDPPAGKEFDQWVFDVYRITDIYAASTTYTVGEANAEVMATYKDLPWLTVINGTGNGSYTAGTVVPIVADTPPAGMEFDQWTGDVSRIADVTSANTTYTMGSASAEVMATYKSATGIEPVEAGIKIYAEGSSVRIESGIAIKLVEIYNPLGQAIRLVRPDSNQAKIDNLPAGILVVKISLQDGRSETRKIGTR